MSTLPLQLLDWGELSPLRIRARALADGLYVGTHRSRRRGSGVEFDGHRDYVPGDDLRRLDYRALARHGRLLVRQFETDTERALCLMLDATASMAFKSAKASAAKLAYAALLAAALGRIAVSSGDLLSLDWLGGQSPLALPRSGGLEAFERLISALERVEPGGDDALGETQIARAVLPIARRAKRGSTIVVLSDLVDLPQTASEQVATLSNRERSVVVVQVLDPVEADFPFDGAVRLQPSTGGAAVETDANLSREGYLRALDALRAEWREALLRHGGRLVLCRTDDDPTEVVRNILVAIEGKRP